MESCIRTKYNELKNLRNIFTVIKNSINSYGIPISGMEELELDELYLSLEDYRIKIEKLEHFLLTINNTLKFKKELIDTANMMLYHPSRINRLLDQGLISLEHSFNEL